MGGGSSSEENVFVKAIAPEGYTPLAPQRTSAEAMPDEFGEASFTTGVRRTEQEKEKKSLGTSRLVIPLAGKGAAQAGGYTAPRKPTGVL